MFDQTVKTIENATADDVQYNDRVVRKHTWESRGVIRTVIREGVAHYQDDGGNWRTKEGSLLTFDEGDGSNVTHTIIRIIQGLPKRDNVVLVANDGHEYITATVNGVTYRAREAILSGGRWHSIWRTATGGFGSNSVRPGCIDHDTWKVDEQ